MAELPKVSIIALCYNQEEYCIETLNSIVNQNYKGILEIIIIDDNSTDNSRLLIQQWITKAKVQSLFIKNSKNIGIVHSLIIGANLSTGKYLQFIACDDILKLNKIANHVALLDKSDNKTSAVFSNAIIINKNGKSLNKRWIDNKITIKINNKNLFSELLKKNFVLLQSLLIKKNYYVKLGGFDSALTYADYDFVLRAVSHSNLIFDANSTLYYRKHQYGESNKIATDHFDTSLMILQKHRNVSTSNDRIIRKHLRKIIYLGLSHDYNDTMPKALYSLTLINPFIAFFLRKKLFSKYLFY